MLLVFMQLFFVASAAVAVNLPPRYYYPNVQGLTEPDRAACYAAADAAYNGTRQGDSSEEAAGWAVYREVGAFEKCVKSRGYKW